MLKKFGRVWQILLVVVPIALQALDALQREPPKPPKA